MRSSPATRSTPGCSARLGAARELHGVAIREVPLAEIAEAVGSSTRLVACSHVGWMSGFFAPAELADVDVPVLLDGAQGVGAVPVDVKKLGCDAYAGAGQKWLCGPDGLGMLYVTPELRAAARRLTPRLRQPRGPQQRRRGEPARGRAALRDDVAERRGRRLLAGRDRAARVGRLERDARARAHTRRAPGR